ncbi:hypothetical protein GGD92_28375 [Pseudomonas protegens]|uniref:Uncharacterized protein n=1 Tax=Pseudomonas protegens TaxID=380021 RepID=A0A7G8YKN0_9PSED|nr:hypothetical protein [Pseudomonas protegens]QNH76230.1 hypothetical protein GGI48_23450 [Pseudomonas protegens]QNL05424.1 hypothetical protein GGD92_28375 [Pseudomonas protegens]
MLTAKAAFVMSSIGLFVRTARSDLLAEDPRVQIASPPKAILAICNESPSHHQDKPLFLRDFFQDRLLARELLEQADEDYGDNAHTQRSTSIKCDRHHRACDFSLSTRRQRQTCRP